MDVTLVTKSSGKDASGAFHIELVQVNYLNCRVIYLNLFQSLSTSVFINYDGGCWCRL